MAEFVGSENQIRLKERLRGRQGWIGETPGVANGGRLLLFVDPASVGWGKVAELANEDQLVGFPGVARDETIAAIHEHLGAQWKTPCWDAFFGRPDQVLPACDELIANVPLPQGWRVDLLAHPDGDEIAAVQALNSETGVSPYPAYYSCGDAVPVLTVSISDGTGELVAAASAADRYHRECRLAGCVFAGMVSVSPAHQGRGLGKLINAVMLAESHKLFNWASVKEQVAADNAASQAMIRACGLSNDEGYVTVAAVNSDERITR